MSEAGLKISQQKIQAVLDFPVPTVGKQLKIFLGTVNYLRDFVRSYYRFRDRLFTIRTDHQNLLFIKEASNPMIVRWYMA